VGRGASTVARLGMRVEADFWAGKRVLVTGQTGFKGAWLSLWLADMGAEVSGLALPPETEPSLFAQLGLVGMIDDAVIDLRDAGAVAARVTDVRADVVFHLGAQALVRRSYADPLETWATNVQGTVNLLEGVRQAGRPCTVIVSTTDKVYANRDWAHGYRETDRLGGHDPYSASKAATEIAIASYRAAFFGEGRVRIGVGRAGNVIGGGDWSADRLVPDIVRALSAGRVIELRNPAATRPWQHVLEPLAGYLIYAQALASGATEVAALNFGPEAGASRAVREVMDVALTHWDGEWRDVSGLAQPHEARQLALSVDLARAELGWTPRLSFNDAVGATLDWYRAVGEGGDALALTRAQIARYGAAA
jgi:CDP-glucose 4,6-dehydratase